MLFLEKLNSRNGSWEDFDQKLLTCKFALVIYDNSIYGCKQEHILSPDQGAHLRSTFKISDIAVAGMNHGNIIGPLMSLLVDSHTHTAKLIEYVTYAHDNSGVVSDVVIRNDLSNLAAYLSFFHKNILYIKMPLITDSFENDICRLDVRDSMCILTIL